MEEFEKPNFFYLGKFFDPKLKKTTKEVFNYDSKFLTTHAVCVGMTGSGKTGLGITLLEEAALNKIPAIIIDPKGDMGNLLLQFPELSAEEFRPWVDAAEAGRKGESVDEYAKTIAEQWKNGLAKWQEDGKRIERLKESVEMAIYTPASKAGIPLSILGSFSPPTKEQALNTSAVRERVSSITSSLLGMLGIDADPIKSREHILLSKIIEDAWSEGKEVTIEMLIQQIQRPSFDKIGAMALDTFFSSKERTNLAVNLNNLLASPGFQAWMEGESLDIQKLLNNKQGKPKLSIISIAHLSDTERMFFVTLLLNQLIMWMRKQPGTSNLGAIFYMDEIFGFFPPTASPPSKLPMLTMLKQARAFGLGIVLATQNPVDLDYKGLANCGTWFIGRLQTERDKARMIEGLNVASNGDINSKEIDEMIAATNTRIFIMRSIHEKQPLLFETRWTLSYLRGPLTLTQIEKLTDHLDKSVKTNKIESSPNPYSNFKPNVPSGIEEYYVKKDNLSSPIYRPLILGSAKLHFVDTKAKLDLWKDVDLISHPTDDGKNVDWQIEDIQANVKQIIQNQPLPDSRYEELPAGLMQEKTYKSFSKTFISWLYQTQIYPLFQFPELGLTSEHNQSEADFRSLVTRTIYQNREINVKKIQEKYNQKIAVISDKIKRAQDKMSQKQQQAGWQKIQTILAAISTMLGAFFKKKITKGTITEANTSIRKIGRMTKDSQSASQAEEEYNNLRQQLNDLQTQMQDEISRIPVIIDPQSLNIEKLEIRPRKSDISVEKIAIIWWPVE